MFAKFKKAVEGAAQRLDVAVAAGTANSSAALSRVRLRRSSQPPAPSAPLSDDRVHSSAAGDLILHYQAQWRAIHAATVAQESERVRVDASLQRVVRDCLRRAATVDSLRKSIESVSNDLPPSLAALHHDVAALALRLAALAATVDAAEREQAIHTAFDKASQHAIEQFKLDPRAAKQTVVDDAPTTQPDIDVAPDDQSLLESFLGPAQASSADDDETAADDSYFGDQV
jgi:hypothetical protein